MTMQPVNLLNNNTIPQKRRYATLANFGYYESIFCHCHHCEPTCMSTEASLLDLFFYETGTHQLVDILKGDVQATTSKDYQHWLSGKRLLVESDDIEGHWVKTCTAGYITELILHSNGHLDEYRLFDRFHTQGSWQLHNGVLQIKTTKGDNHYSFDVVGNASINIHSAIERKNGELHAYLKVMQIK